MKKFMSYLIACVIFVVSLVLLENLLKVNILIIMFLGVFFGAYLDNIAKKIEQHI